MADLLSVVKTVNKGYNQQVLVLPAAVKASGTYDIITCASSAKATAELNRLKKIAEVGSLKIFFKPSSGTETSVELDVNGVGFVPANISDTGYVLKVSIGTSTTKLQVGFASVLS